MGDIREDILKRELQHTLERAKHFDKTGDKRASSEYMKASSIYNKLAGVSSGEKSKQNYTMSVRYHQFSESVDKRDSLQTEKPEDLGKMIDSLIISHKPDTKWEDIGGLEEVKTEIKEVIILPFIKRKPDYVEAPRTLLLYGPPGTGKTLIAKAASNVLSATFFEARVSALLSKYFGESPKLLNSLFLKAKSMQPSLIFMDELDSLAVKRSGETSASTRRVLSQLLMEIDGFNTKGSDKVIIIAATNAPWDLDDAVISRFQKKVYIPLPNKEAKKKIFSIHLKNAKLGVDIDKLADLAENFSGRDISNVCKEAIMHMIREQNPSLGELTSESVEHYSLKHRPLTLNDFKIAFKTIKPAIDVSHLKRYEEWESSFGG